MSLKRYALCFLQLTFAAVSHASGVDSSRVRNLKVYPFPVVGYAPETRWYFGAVALFNFRLSQDSVTKNSTLETEFNYTQNRQVVATANYELRLRNNKWFLTGDNGYYKFPEEYWGYGISSQPDDKIHYDARRIEIDNSILRKLAVSPYIGIRYRYHYMNITEADDTSLLHKTIIESGIGVRAVIDTRDNVLNATTGTSFSFSALFFSPSFGGDNSFRRFDTDFRYYTTIHKKGVLATQVVLSNTWGTVPFRMLPMMGSESIMRGYYQGRYRDKHLMAAQLEYRFGIWNWVGAVAFAGGGTLLKYNNAGDPLIVRPSYGGGLRIRIDKKDNVNLRFDYGVGYQSDGFYVSFGEAF